MQLGEKPLNRFLSALFTNRISAIMRTLRRGKYGDTFSTILSISTIAWIIASILLYEILRILKSAWRVILNLMCKLYVLLLYKL